MSSKTFFKLTLLLPYILLGICAAVLCLIYLLYLGISTSLPMQLTETTLLSESLVAVFGTISPFLLVLIFYTFGALFWFIPYTVLAIGLLLWSIHKPTDKIYKVSLFSPLLLAMLMVTEAVIFFIPGSESTIGDVVFNILFGSLLFGGSSLAFGYLFVGTALGLYKLLQYKNIIKDETTTNIVSAGV